MPRDFTKNKQTQVLPAGLAHFYPFDSFLPRFLSFWSSIFSWKDALHARAYLVTCKLGRRSIQWYQQLKTRSYPHSDYQDGSTYTCHFYTKSRPPRHT